MRWGGERWPPYLGGENREGFLEEVASEPTKGQSIIQGRRGERAWQGSKSSRCRGKQP